MRIAITGAGGMLGQDLAAVLRERHEILALDHRTCDVSDQAAVRRVFCEWRPKLVVNCAAFADVDGCELDPERALAVNGRGAGHVARTAEQVGARVFYVSTDYVFNGENREPYQEDDPTDPISRYGRSKLAGEQETFGPNGAGAGHLVIRTSWLYGLHRPNFVEKVLADAQSQPKLVAVADQISCPTWTLHLSRKIEELAETPARGILHIVNPGPCSRQEMAQAIVERLPKPVPVGAIFWKDLNRPARRPAYSVLGCRRLEQLGLTPLPHWRKALEEYIRMRQAVSSAEGRKL
ncbi:MAG: dTDP-4-dehydrorhamnose reductase [Terriglobia bacterium]